MTKPDEKVSYTDRIQVRNLYFPKSFIHLKHLIQPADIYNMNELKHKMIRQAVERYSAIYPLMSRKDLRECFTTEGNMLLFWFNTADQSTHVLKVSLS